MAKHVGVIDIGSNSIRIAIYEKTSRFAFHLLYETKSKVRISEDAYKNGGYLQDIPMQRAFDALSDFIDITKSFKVRKILCVATSALRDAPNKQKFIQKVRKDLKLNIKVIDGDKEAYFGAIACANLLPKQDKSLSIDIGGGSTEFALIKDNNVLKTISLPLGTVRLKELFFDKNQIDEAIKYIDTQLDSFLNNIDADTLIGIGGTFRAISNAIIKSSKYPFAKLHAYECDKNYFNDYISQILKSDNDKLKTLGIKPERFDIIKPGALILQRVLIKVDVKKLQTSGVGVREGVYLKDLLRGSKDKFPNNYNTSLRYLLDSHIDDTTFSNQVSSLSKKIFDLTSNELNIDKNYRYELSIASKLYGVGNNIHFFSNHKHSYYLIQSALEYGFSHSQILLISTLAKYAKGKYPSNTHLEKYEMLLPDTEILNKLIYILSVSITLLSNRPKNIEFDLDFKDNHLYIKSKKRLYLVEGLVKKVVNKNYFSINIEN